MTLKNDIAIIMKTVKKVFKRENITERGEGKNIDFDKYRKEKLGE